MWGQVVILCYTDIVKSNIKQHKDKVREIRSAEGIITISHKGFGVVRIKGQDDTVEIEHNFLHTACHGDTVKILLHPKRSGLPETGEVSEILRRSKKGYSGVLEKENDTYFLIPSDLRMYADIVIPQNKLAGAKIGQKVFVVITDWKDAKKAPIGKIEKVLGMPMEHNAEMEAIAMEKGFSSDFPSIVKNEASEISKRGITDKDLKSRRDMRSVTTFTIDPVDAKDFDDAISLERLLNGHLEIGIHIADVSHYVKLNTTLDDEAQSRGTSVYLVDRTIPMLPEELSNGLCSLNEGVDRLTFSAIFELDMSGKIYSEWFGETIIHSDKRFTYENAQKILDNKKGEFYDELNTLNLIAKKLNKKRFDEGAIMLEQEEVKFKLDSSGVPISVYTKARGDTNKLVEEFMLLANRRVAEYMSSKKKGTGGVFLYRIHDLPNKEKMKDLAMFLKRLGYHMKLKDGIIPSEEINILIGKLEHNPLRDTVHTAIIRTMAKAIYSTKNIGHYGLGFKFYTHFTSPIRRYPDVIVHRLLKDFLSEKVIPKEKWYEYEHMSQEASNQEKEAAEAERASIKYKQVEYMSKRVGQTYEGIITGVTEWGLYVEESETKCEGMIRMRDLKDDYYIFDKKFMSIRGQKSHKKYTLGDKTRFRVVGADMNKKTIDYTLI
ncbi:MAG: Ribonuclease R [Candidatus Nomurabacteria bacterium GW2011_GWF2_35_66]|uniref:Ribonuclease R n=1 Tax=Candidatus Nomurabacteria bacterium GW2011_GWE1_35_16 TaxID=1618761 RepID=A0A0G0DUQ3_9BACT|nr:MAG: Ribonuclease R [Candidatus Nomurabacteria bacterium GW2011_GWF1_34_20]KKP63558.1 MAG: Ribonuclease R [Candidatus Nomurabacteria bacterium GW2011_GWE2_34_25]KKP66750.1 MAG: Ribonuclease R [Candidatus Nomurabacteria bacterium GW2011_GWE1_35_16]KKP83850.1 MAG: Ribonuclease R [Candidatus Nomurabacteria bacterium GW2011_GWF2_35_66]HAE36361.1 ribonuclease R [Candidatus Nomurabacteria bacterium]